MFGEKITTKQNPRRSPGSAESLEAQLRKAITVKNWDDAVKLLSELTSTRLASGRDAIFVITETNRRGKSLSAIIPLISTIPLQQLDYTTEDDIIPTLVDLCNKPSTGMKFAAKLVGLLIGRGVKFSAKTYSILISGYGRQKNEDMIDGMLRECIKYKVKADLVLFNSALDAYIR
jgi:pentatricopeptide repeat protein